MTGLVDSVLSAGSIAVAGAVVAVLLILVWVLILARLVWARHRVPTDRVVTLLAAGVALVLSADGAYRLLTRGLGLPAWEAAVVAAVAELALIAEAVRAERNIRRHGHPGGHQYAIAGIALGAGLVVSSNAASVPEWLVRFLVPQLAALLWWMGAREDITTHHGTSPAQDAVGTTWLVSPRRLAVQVGLIAATDGVDDIHALTRVRRVRALARLLHRHSHTQSATVRRWRARRVHRLAETADTATITAVADQLVRTRTVLGMAGLLTDDATGGVAPAQVAAHGLTAPVLSIPSGDAAPLAPQLGRVTGETPRHDVAAAGAPAPLTPPTRPAANVAAPRPADPIGAATPSPGGRPPRRARPTDVARVRAALAAGDLPAPVTASAIALHLGISREYAAAARHALDEVTGGAHTADVGQPTPLPLLTLQDQAGVSAEPSGPDEYPTATAAGPPRRGHVEDYQPAHHKDQTDAVPARPSYTHA